MNMAIDKEKAIEGRIRMGAAIRSIRELEQITCEQLGERVGITRHTVSKIETGKYAAGADTLSQLADAMGYEWTLKKKEE